MTDKRVWVNVEVAIVRDGRYLMIERGAGESHGAGWLGFPGGTLKPEVAIDALVSTARREVREEVGLELQGEVEHVESHTFALDVGLVLDVVMLTKSSDGKARAQDADEVAAFSWMTPEEIRHDRRVQPFTLASLVLCEAKRALLDW